MDANTVWVAVKVTGSAGQFKPVTVEMGACVPSEGDPLTAGDALYQQLQALALARLAELEAAAMAQAQPAPQATPAPASRPPATSPARTASKPAALDASLRRAYLGKDAQPGEWAFQPVNSFDVAATKDGSKTVLKFYAEGLEFPVASVTEGTAAYPTAWASHFKAGRNPLSKPTWLLMQVSSKANAKGGYYRDVLSITHDDPGPGPDTMATDDDPDLPW